MNNFLLLLIKRKEQCNLISILGHITASCSVLPFTKTAFIFIFLQYCASTIIGQVFSVQFSSLFNILQKFTHSSVKIYVFKLAVPPSELQLSKPLLTLPNNSTSRTATLLPLDELNNCIIWVHMNACASRAVYVDNPSKSLRCTIRECFVCDLLFMFCYRL